MSCAGTLNPITGAGAKRTRQSTRKGTAVGGDQLAPSDLDDLPLAAWDQLADLFNDMEVRQACPLQFLGNVMASLAPPTTLTTILHLLVH